MKLIFILINADSNVILIIHLANCILLSWLCCVWAVQICQGQYVSFSVSNNQCKVTVNDVQLQILDYPDTQIFFHSTVLKGLRDNALTCKSFFPMIERFIRHQ